MTPKLFTLIGLCSLLFCSSQAAEENNDPLSRKSPGEQILKVTNVILQNHIDPPTRQEMFLAATKALYRSANQVIPKGLSETLSRITDPAVMANHLNRVSAELGNPEDHESIALRGVFDVLPGGGFVVDQKTDRVNQQVLANRYVGIGIVLKTNTEEKRAQLAKVFYKGPAWKAGMKNDDLFLEIDGEDTASKDLNLIVEELRGAAGTDVTVVVRQPDSTETRSLTMTRDRVFIPSIHGYAEKSLGQWDYTIEHTPHIAYLRFNAIGPSTRHELQQIEQQLHDQDLQGIILDVRSGGGILHDVIMVADSLLDGGLIGHVRDLDRTRTYKAEPGALFQDVPMAVLVDHNTNADRVFLTAALQDHERATVIGQPTGGQTYVNSMVSLPGTEQKIRLATAVMQRGDGTTLLLHPNQSISPINPFKRTKVKGKVSPSSIIPDHIVQPAAGNETQADPVLAKAIEILQTAHQS